MASGRAEKVINQHEYCYSHLFLADLVYENRGGSRSGGAQVAAQAHEALSASRRCTEAADIPFYLGG